jgi:glycosyltransferase involved in cell wall biosynthesis
MIYADQRWSGNHGIGRFAREALADLHYEPVRLATHPAAPMDAWRLARALRRSNPRDLFFSPGYNTPLFCPAQFVFTIHDLSHVYCPENSSAAIRLYYATVMRRACHRAAKIFTVSEFTRSQIVEWSGVDQEKVVNVGCGIDPSYRPDGDVYGLPFPYLLCVSNRKRHKNEFRMVEAFARAAIDSRIHLVFTGASTTELAAWIDGQQIKDRVDFVGVVPEEQLPSLYRGAAGLIFTSLYEGFGLPVLEAMACGTPVLTSNTTAMPEVAGGAALLVDPTSVVQIALGIARVVEDGSFRRQIREKGIRQAGRFDWTEVKDTVHRTLLEIGESPKW